MLGDDEVLVDHELTAGDYWLHISRAAGVSDVQRYDLTLDIEAAATAVPVGGQPLAGLGLGVYPNPFNPETTVQFYVGDPGLVSLEIFDIAGRLVRRIEAQAQAAVWMEVVWNGQDDRGRKSPSGIYFMRALVGNRNETVRAVLLK